MENKSFYDFSEEKRFYYKYLINIVGLAPVFARKCVRKESFFEEDYLKEEDEFNSSGKKISSLEKKDTI